MEKKYGRELGKGRVREGIGRSGEREGKGEEREI